MTPGTDDWEARGCTVRLSDHFAKVSARYRTLRERDFEAVRIVSDVVARAVDLGRPVRLVDVATGSGRYLDAVNHCPRRQPRRRRAHPCEARSANPTALVEPRLPDAIRIADHNLADQVRAEVAGTNHPRHQRADPRARRPVPGPRRFDARPRRGRTQLLRAHGRVALRLPRSRGRVNACGLTS